MQQKRQKYLNKFEGLFTFNDLII